MSDARKRVVIVGGGIAGLAAAHRLVERAEDAIEVVLLEAGAGPGGVIRTTTSQDLLVELGPDSFITDKPWAVDLCRRLGMDQDLIGTQGEFRRTLVVRDGELLPLPEAFQMMAPGKLRPFLASRILSWPGRLRALLDLVLPRGGPPPGGDETLASFVRRRLGREVLERIAQPVVGGIYTANPETLSLATTIPRFLDMERQHRSIILALMRQNRKAAASASRGTSGARFDLFATPQAGVSHIVEAILARLPQGSVRTGQRATRITRSENWRIETADKSTLDADAVIVALPAPRAAEILGHQDEALAGKLAEIEYASSAVAALVYRRADLGVKPDFFGIVVPAREKLGIVAISLQSVKFAGRAPGDLVTLRVFLGGALAPEVLQESDEELCARARKAVGNLLGAQAAPVEEHLARWPEAMPQYAFGHAMRVFEIEEAASRWPGLALAGNAYHGVGLPDSIHSGEQAADSLLASGILGREFPRESTRA